MVKFVLKLFYNAWTSSWTLKTNYFFKIIRWRHMKVPSLVLQAKLSMILLHIKPYRIRVEWFYSLIFYIKWLFISLFTIIIVFRCIICDVVIINASSHTHMKMRPTEGGRGNNFIINAIKTLQSCHICMNYVLHLIKNVK